MQGSGDTHSTLFQALHDRYHDRPIHDVEMDQAGHLDIAHQLNLRLTTVIIAVYEYLEFRNLKGGSL